jgi:uncharacterized protein (TIGR02118 family)
MKQFSLFKRREDISRNQFLDYWRFKHGPLARGVPEFRNYASVYIQNHPGALPLYLEQQTSYDFDGIVELWTSDNEADREAFYGSDNYENRLKPDELVFINRSQSHRVRAYEVKILEGNRTPLKYMTFFNSAPGLTRQEFLDHWESEHVRLIAEVSGFWKRLRKYTQNHFDMESWKTMDGRLSPLKFGGAAQLWFDDLDSFNAAFAELASSSAVQDDVRYFMGGERSHFLLTEYQMIGA